MHPTPRPHTAPALALALALAACPDDAPPADTADASTDITPSDALPDTRPDASPDTSSDTSPGDVIPEPLAGTHLSGITITWAEPLTLCSAWNEGASIEAEVSHRVQVTLPPQTRTDLEASSLLAAVIAGAELLTGPFAADRFSPAPTTAATTLLDFTVSRGPSDDGLFARVRHDLGPAGALVETYNVFRAAGDTRPVVVTESGFELTFAWSPPGDPTPHLLEPCAIPEHFELAVEVLPATRSAPAPDDSVTLVRFYRTPHFEASAGSYPVRLVATQVVLSDMAWSPFEVTGFWSQIYAADHHNWNDRTRLDFSRDLAAWQTTFSPLSRGEPVLDGALARVQLEDVADLAGGAPGRITVTRLSRDGTPSDTVYPETAPTWRRVDANHLGRALAATCPGGQGLVGAAGYGEHVAQLMLCPDPAGPRGLALVGVVPVVWQMAPMIAGQRFEGDAITRLSGRLGWAVALGGGTLVVEPADGDAFITDVLDASGHSLSSAWSPLYPIEPLQRWQAPVHSVSADGEVTVRIDRRWAAQGVGESAIYAVASLTLTALDTTWTVDAWDRLAYVNTHHNWQDELTATADDGHTLHWKIAYDFEQGLVEHVWITAPDGSERLAPTRVVPVPSTPDPPTDE